MRETEKRLIEEIKKQLGDVTIEVKDIPKNNGVILRGLCISAGGSNVCPVVYIDSAIQEIEEGNTTVEKAARILAEAYEQASRGAFSNFKPTREMILQSVIPVIINAELNSEMLQGIPHKKFLDLAVVFRCCVKKGASFLIRKETMQPLDLTFDDLWRAAINNARRVDFETKSMTEILKEGGMSVPDNAADMPMYVLTNTIRLYGANVLLFREHFRWLAEKLESDLYILPSSIHEVIAVPVDDYVKPEVLREMVSTVNLQEVDSKEVLSNSVYLYSREKDEILIA